MFNHIKHLAAQAQNVPGDFMEIGVFRGKTFRPMADFAASLGRTIHAVDSFEGMAEPGPLDGDEYPKGKLSVGGLSEFQKLVGPCPNAVFHVGWVPEVLAEINTTLAFVHVDLDHYLPTLVALHWAWARMSPGGILMSHDWFPGKQELASAAIQEFIDAGHKPTGTVGITHHIYWTR